MKLTVRRLAAARDVEIEITGPTLLVGPNEAGKTTTLTALRALVGGDKNLGASTKAALAAIIREGSEDGVAELEGGDWSARGLWPAAEITSRGAVPAVSAMARGELSFARAPAAERSGLLYTALGCKVPGAALKARIMQDAGIDDESANAVLIRLKETGWDAAERHYKEAATKGKGAWEHVTSDRWGAKKAESWRPAGWEASQETVTPEAADYWVDEAERAANDAAMAFVQAQTADLATKLPELEAEERRLHEEVAEWDAKIKLGQDQADAARKEVATAGGVPCPWCNKPLDLHRPNNATIEVRKAEVKEGAAVTAEELKAKRMRVADLDGELNKTRGARDKVWAQFCHAVEQVKKAKETASAGGGDLAGLDQKRRDAVEALVKIKAGRDRVKRADEAARVATTIAINLAIAAVLAPAGIRREELRRRLADFHSQHLLPLAAAAGIPELRIDEEAFEVHRGGLPYARLSRGARFLADAVLQMALGRAENAPLLIFDDADQAVGANRTGFIKALAAARIPAVAAIAAPEVGKLDQVVAAKLGRVYRMEHGAAVEVKAP